MEQTNSATIENEASTSNSNDISVPQLTDERKQEIRRQLLERQRKARLQNSSRASTSSEVSGSPVSPSSSNYAASVASSTNNDETNNANTNNTTTTTNTLNNTNTIHEKNEDDNPPNREMIKKAIAFLTSPKVQNAPTSRKHSFLLSKGCTKKEIELAEKEIEEKGLLSGNSSNDQSYSQPLAPATINYNNTPGQNPPPLPPRNYQPQNIQIVYRLSRRQKVQRGILIILFGGALIKGLSVIVKREIIKPLRVLYQHYAKYLRNRNNILNKYMLQIIQYCALFVNDKNKDKAKHIKTIEEIEKEKEKIKEITAEEEKEDKEKEKEKEKEKDENKGEEEKEGEKEKEEEIVKKKPKERKAIKLKIHRKKEANTTEETELATEETPLLSNKDNTEAESGSLIQSESVRTLSSALQDYINNTNSLGKESQDAIDNYAYDIERLNDFYCGTLGQAMKISSEIYQIVSRETYHNSFYINPYQSSDDDYGNAKDVPLMARVNNIKSDIRRLKGMLLNHRNFPKYKERRAFSTPVVATSSNSEDSS